MTSRYRPRKELKFWLFLDKPEESRLVEFINYCKSKRSFARVVRDGIRLMWSLGEGDTSVLFELFPGLRAQLLPVDAIPPPPDTDKLERQIADLRKIILEQGSFPPPPKDYPQMKSGKLQKSVALPLFDDEEEDFGVGMKLTKSANSPLNGGNLLGGILGMD